MFSPVDDTDNVRNKYVPNCVSVSWVMTPCAFDSFVCPSLHRFVCFVVNLMKYIVFLFVLFCSLP